MSEEKPSPQAGASRQDELILRGVLILVLLFLAYYPALHGGYVWDDDHYVTANPMLTAPEGLRQIWFSGHHQSQYFPLAFTTMRYEYWIWGMDPMGYHLVNVLFHGANVLLLWTVLRRLAVPGAWLAAAIFALHPVQVESVAWISELKNVQSTFFYLLALLAWLRFTDRQTAHAWRFYGLALLWHALALTSKTTACTLPAAMLLVLWMRREPIGGRRIIQLIPFLALGIAMGAVSIWWEWHLGNYKSVQKGLDLNFSAAERLLIATRALWFYAAKLVWPANLTFSYPRWDINPANPLQYLGVIGCLGVALLLWWRRKALGRGPATAVLFFVATLAPMLGLISFYTFYYSFVADHYQYLASAGLITLFAAAASAWMKSMHQSLWVQRVLLSALVLLLGVLTWRQAGMYADPETLWRATLSRNPESFMAESNLGVLLANRGELDAAIVHFLRSVEIQPNADESQNNLGEALFLKGRVDESIAHFEKALAAQPEDVQARANLGVSLSRKGQLDEAMVQLKTVLRTDPENIMAQNELGVVLLEQGATDDAILHFRKVLEIQPSNFEALCDLGDALIQQRQVDEAIGWFQNALVLRPNSPRVQSDLGNALLRKGQVNEALLHYGAALKLEPNNVSVLNNLCWILATCPQESVRNGSRAVELGQRAEQLTGGRNAWILDSLAAAFAEAGRFSEATATAGRALQLATAHNDTAHADTLRAHIKLYDSGSPVRDTSLTSAQASQTAVGQ